MKINPLASTMFLLSTVALGRKNTVAGFVTPTSFSLRSLHKTTSLYMNAEEPKGMSLFISHEEQNLVNNLHISF